MIKKHAIYQEIKSALLSHASEQRAIHNLRFFKCAKGEYGEGDKFAGVTSPQLHALCKEFRTANIAEVELLLKDEIHECRLLALFIMIEQYNRGDERMKELIYNLYISNTRYINNWDLVDNSAYKIIGAHLFDKDRTLLYDFSKSNDLWRQRIAIVSTMYFIRRYDFTETIALSEILLTHSHDLIHKAVGWLLREMGKKDESALLTFLDKHYTAMPRTMLRYAIERLSIQQKAHYMKRQ